MLGSSGGVMVVFGEFVGVVVFCSLLVVWVEFLDFCIYLESRWGVWFFLEEFGFFLIF